MDIAGHAAASAWRLMRCCTVLIGNRRPRVPRNSAWASSGSAPGRNIASRT
jgi:hypothetical protein